jgi:hypothetical protein
LRFGNTSYHDQRPRARAVQPLISPTTGRDCFSPKPAWPRCAPFAAPHRFNSAACEGGCDIRSLPATSPSDVQNNQCSCSRREDTSGSNKRTDSDPPKRVLTCAGGRQYKQRSSWTYSIQDGSLDFVDAGEKITLTFVTQIDDGHSGQVSQRAPATRHCAACWWSWRPP